MAGVIDLTSTQVEAADCLSKIDPVAASAIVEEIQQVCISSWPWGAPPHLTT